MKRLAMFIGGLLVLPAFGEVAPVFYDDIEYTDVVYDEYGNPVYYTDDGEYDLTPVVNEAATKPSVSTSRNGSGTRANTNRTTIGRTVPTAATTTATGRGVAANASRAVAARTTTNASPRSATNARSVASRGTTTSRTTSTGATRTTTNVAASAAAANRATGGAGRASASATRTSSGGASVARTTTTRATATSRGGTTSRVATTGSRVNRAATNAAVGMVTTAGAAAPVRVTSISGTTGAGYFTDSGNALYNANRASVASSRVGARIPTIRMTSATSEVSVTAADLSAMDELAEMTDYCKAQYAACMDNYCNVLDDNQGRCSCSANIKNYANAEAALKSATEELQEVAQQIQYIGLSAREVETLFTQTEAELKMQTTTDTSQLKTSLDKIKDMIIEVQSGTATSTANSSALSFDLSGLLDFTIDSTGFDLTSFLGGFGTTTTGGINNQRGTELFKTATNRCKTNVLRACTAAGVDASLITNAYDLEIDKECIIYERALNDSNDQMIATVRNAKNVLQRARLLVEQSKNEYDMRGCINALDSCMQDEYVCGSDYEKCLDPSGRYIVNGEIVIGSDPGRAVNGLENSSVGVLDGDICTMNLYNVWNYGSGSTAGQTTANCKNAWNSWSRESDNGDLAAYIDETLGENGSSTDDNLIGVSQYIQNKIGWVGTGKNKDRNYGMCISVLNKCQDYTYTGNGSSRAYNPKNEVVKQYLNRVLIQIKARQDQILAEHAESCIADVQSCLSQNGYPFDEENLNANSIAANIAINACRSTIVTCMSVNGYSVDNPTPSDLWPWVCGITTGSTDCSGSGGETETYTVIFDCLYEGAGTVESITQSVPGEYIKLPAFGCNPSGFTQTGWDVPPVGGTCETAGARIKPTRNMTVDACYNQDTVVVTLDENYAGAARSKKLYYANSKWYTDSGKTNQITQLPYDMYPNYTGYKLRGFTDVKQTAVQENTNGDLSGAGLVIDKNYNFKKGPSGTTIYAAWAKECQYDECTMNIGDNGNVTYTANCSGSTAGSGYTIHCANGTEPVWYTYNLNDNGGSGSNPSTIYYQKQSGISNCAKGWYKTNNCSGERFTGLTTKPTNGSKIYEGHYIGNDESHLVLLSSGEPNTTIYEPGEGQVATIFAKWRNDSSVEESADFRGGLYFTNGSN